MRAAVYDHPGPPDVLHIKQAETPVCAVDGVVIRVEAISLEGGDLINRAQADPPEGAGVLGYAAAGVVVEVGMEVSHLKVGQRVTTFDLSGSHAEYRAVTASRAWSVSDALDLAKAACIPIGFGTAQHCLFGRGRLQPGETVLIQGGAGGVGVAAIQLARLAGATVIATVSGSERVAQLKALGLDHAIDHRTTDVVAAVKNLTGGLGADLVVDPIGSTLRTSLAALRPEGRLVVVGNAGGGALDVELWPALQANQSLLGVFMGTQLEKPQVHAAVSRLLEQAARAEIDVPIARTFSLDEIAKAHRYAEETAILGRVVVLP